jgi:lipoprotein-anchoring transpeptidase ErfK/SrfK
VQPRVTLAHPEIVHGPHVEATELEHEEHLGGPAADPAHQRELLHDLVIGTPADAIEHDRPRNHVLGEIADRRGLRRRESGAPERLDRRGEHLLGRGFAVEERNEAPVDRPSGRPRELLVADRPGQLGEVRPARATAPEVARPGRLDDPGELGGAPGKVGTCLHELTSGHEGHRIRDRYPRTLVIRRAHLALALAVALFAAGCGGGGGANLGRQVETPSTKAAAGQTRQAGAYVAQAVVPLLAVYDTPGDASPAEQLDNPWVVSPDYPDQTVPQVFLVKERRNDGWVRVLLPVRPNGSTGWVRTSDVRLTANDFHVQVELGAHRITVTQSGSVLYQGSVAIGTDETPTPTGEYYVRVKVKAIDPTTVYGPYAWGLSSHSDALETFNGGDAEIGIHGNNDASVLGEDVTHGCVRMDNDAITTLTETVPLGTPVDIVA